MFTAPQFCNRMSESCGFHQNVVKEIVYMKKASIAIGQINILCFVASKLAL